MATGASKSDRLSEAAGSSAERVLIQGKGNSGAAIKGKDVAEIISINDTTPSNSNQIVSSNTDANKRNNEQDKNITAPASLINKNARVDKQQNEPGLDISASFNNDKQSMSESGYSDQEQSSPKLSLNDLSVGLTSMTPTRHQEKIVAEEEDIEKYKEKKKKEREERKKQRKERRKALKEKNTGATKKERPKPNINPIAKSKSVKVSTLSRISAPDTSKLTADKFKNKYPGSGIYAKLLSSNKIGMREVGLGYKEYLAFMRIPNNSLIRLAKDHDVDTTISDPYFLALEINKARIPVAIPKSPVSEKYSFQKRILKIMLDETTQRGAFLHPLVAEIYKADYDGDDITIMLNKQTISIAEDPIKYLKTSLGQPNISEKFFPRFPIVDGYREGKTAEDYVKEVMFPDIPKNDLVKDPNNDGKYIVNPKNPTHDGYNRLAKSIVEFSQKKGTTKDLFDGLGYYANKVTVNESDIIALVLDRLYNQMLRGSRSYIMEITSAVWTDLPQNMNAADNAIISVTTDIVSGKPFANFQDYKVAACRYLGNDPSGSAPFRITGVGKGYKISSDFKIGDEYRIESDEAWEDCWKKTLAYAQAKLIASVEEEEGKAKFYSDEMRRDVIAEVGNPNKYDNYLDFIKAFASSYNKCADRINQSDAAYSTVMGLIDYKPRFTPIKNLEVGELANPLLKIYRDYKTRDVFPNIRYEELQTRFKDNDGNYLRSKEDSWRYSEEWYLLEHYMDMPLRKFAYDNKLIKNQSDQEKMNKKDVRSLDSDNEIEYYLAMSIADKRTADESEFNTTVYGQYKDGKVSQVFNGNRKTAIAITSEILNNMVIDVKSDNTRGLEDSRDIFVALGPSMMRYFGMTSVDGILKSEYGKAMMDNRNDLDILGGIRESMVYSYSKSRLDSFINNISKAENPKKKAYYATEAAKERSHLKEKSDCWRAIIMELDSGEAWASIRDTKSQYRSPYWDRCKHDNLDQFMKDLSVKKSDRDHVLADITKYHLDYQYITSMEMPCQLEIGSYSDGSDNLSSKIQTDFERNFNSWENKKRANLLSNISSIKKRIKEDRTFNLKSAIHKAANSKCYTCYVPSTLVADSIAFEAADKTWGQTEKNKQHPGMNTLFSAVSYIEDVFGLDSQYRTDSRAIGVIPYNNISTKDILMILDGNTIYTNDEFGHKIELSNKKIFGTDNPTDNQILSFLDNNPYVAAALRPNKISSRGNINGRATIGALGKPFDVSYSTEDEVAHTLYSAPGFLGLSSILTPMNNTAAGDRSRKINRNIKNLVNMIRFFASHNDLSVEMALNDIGVTVDALENILQSDFYNSLDEKSRSYYVRYLGNLNMEDDAIETAEEIYDNIVKDINNYIEKVQRDFPNDSVDSYDSSTFAFDQSSIASYWDVIAESSACRTEIMTGIEGSQTKKYAFWASLSMQKDNYADLLVYIDKPEELEKLKGCMTNFGVFDGNIENLIHRDENGDIEEIVIEVPEDFVVLDRTIDTYGNQVPTMSSFFEHNRSKGAEDGNLKFKKQALDGLDSITKFVRFSDVDYKQLIAEVNSKNTDFDAHMVVAKYMKEAADEAKFDDYTLANYMSLASVMVKKLDTGEYVIRSLDQLMSAVRGIINNNIGEINAKNYREAKDLANAIVNDTSENAIGAKESDIDVAEFLNNIAPVYSIASDYVMRSGRHSSFSINKALREVVDKRRPNFKTERIVKNLMNKYLASNKELKKIKEWVDNVKSLKDYIFAGELCGINVECNGPRYIKVLKNTDENFSEQLLEAKARCNTVLFSANDKSRIDEVMSVANIAEEAIPLSENLYMISFWRAELDGLEDASNVGGRFWIGHRPKNRVITSVELKYNWFGQGDASVIGTKNLAEKIDAKKEIPIKIDAYDLFQNTINAYKRKAVFKPSMCSRTDIERFISNDEIKCTIDYGMPEKDSDFKRHKMITDAAIERFINNANRYDPDFTLYDTEMEPGDIFGWAMMEISDPEVGELQYTISPIIPINIDSGPSTFKIVEKDKKFNNGKLELSVLHETNLYENAVKFYDTSDPANKMMMTFDENIHDMDLFGTNVDAYYFTESTASRHKGTNRRMKTLASLCEKARLETYNFAESDESFPREEDSELKERLLSYPWDIKRSEWEAILNNNEIIYHTDPILNVYVRMQCKKFWDNGGNPSDFLANRFETQVLENGEISYKESDIDYEYEGMFNRGIPFLDATFRFYNTLNPDLIPYGIEGDDTDTYFKINREPGYDFGSLLVDVPLPNEDGTQITYIPKGGWAYFGYGFFGDDNTGWSRYNVEGASRYMDAYNTMMLAGEEIKGYPISQIAKFSQTDIENIPIVDNAVNIEEK